ncbi:MAG: NAD-dependent epimerase/dehydratase family protein [Ardenticatenales bacterium]|nr:NAD-dependent epimerase/dehydratase family protein [Ardenticatenales bacterium]
MRYFLTGATGFIGGYLAKLLRQEGHEVVALVRTPSKAKALAELGITLHEGDITDKESLRAPMSGADGIFHLAAWYKVGANAKEKALAEEINVQGTRNVLEMMKELTIPKGIYTSTLAIFSDTEGRVPDESYRYDGSKGFLSEYDRTKWMAHYEVALPMVRAGLPLVILQPGVVYGPDDPSSIGSTLRDYLQGKVPAIPKSASFCWSHVEDIARAHLQAMEKGQPGETYIIAGEVATLERTLKLAQQITGKPAPRLLLPKGLTRGLASFLDVVGSVLPLPSAYTAEGLRAASATYLGDNARAKRELGYNPRSLETGLRETLQHEMKQLGMTSGIGGA